MLSSQSGYADGAWHHAAASLSSSGTALYVDGALVASNAAVTTAQDYTGTWCLGNSPKVYAGAGTYTGSLDDVRVYSRALAPYEVYDQYAAGRS